MTILLGGPTSSGGDDCGAKCAGVIRGATHHRLRRVVGWSSYLPPYRSLLFGFGFGITIACLCFVLAVDPMAAEMVTARPTLVNLHRASTCYDTIAHIQDLFVLILANSAL